MPHPAMQASFGIRILEHKMQNYMITIMYKEIEREIYKYHRGREKDRRERDTDRQENRQTKICIKKKHIVLTKIWRQ